MPLNLTRRSLTFAALAAGWAGPSLADTYPSRAITLLLPSSPGSAMDATARRLAPALAKALGQAIVIDNRPGAGGLIGTTQIARSAPDGYTLGVISSTYSANVSLFPPSFDPLRDIQPVCIISGGPSVLVINANKVPASTLKDVLELARKNGSDKPLMFGNAGNGSTVHMAAAQLGIAAKVNFSHIPYRTVSAYTTDLVGGVLDAGFLPIIVALPLIKEGRLRPIAVSTLARAPLLPSVPTIHEAGVPGYNVDGWVALVAPAKVPPPLLQRLHAEVVRIVREPDFSAYAAANGGTVIASSMEEAEKTIARDIEDNARVIKLLGIKAD